MDIKIKILSEGNSITGLKFNDFEGLDKNTIDILEITPGFYIQIKNYINN